MKHDEIVSILCELYKISGLRVSLHGTDFEEIAAYPVERLPFCAAVQKNESEYARCVACDSDACRHVKETGEAYIYECRYGLTEVICPLYNFGTLTGYIMMGQVASDNAVNAELCNKVKLNAGEEAAKLFPAVQKVSRDILRSYMKIMTICAEYMTLTNALPSPSPRVPELAKIYLHERFAEKITIKDICRSLGCSKSALLSAFKAEYGRTVNDYLSEIRIDESKKLLSSTNMSISAIAEATGFYDQSYFSKVFSQRIGVTPTEYRKELGK